MAENEEPAGDEKDKAGEETEEKGSEATETVEESAESEEAAAEGESEVEPPAPEPEEPEVERHELSKEPVIDVKALLQPVSADAPSGNYLRYEGVYDEISEARRADEILEQGAWQSELKTADYREVISLAVPVIEKQSKDLQITAWLCEALGSEHGFTGVRDGLELVRKMLRKFWPTLYPEAEDGDEEGRANALEWIDEHLAGLLKKAPITADGWGYNGYVDSKKFDIPDSMDGLSSDDKLRYGELKEQADRENRATAAQWAAAVARTRRAFCEEVEVALEEVSHEYEELNKTIEEVFDRNQAPSLPDMRSALSDIKSRAQKLLEMKKLEEPDPSDIEESEGEEGGAEGGAGVPRGAIRNREDALRRLSEIAAFFKRSEPHSPVSYLVNRAVAWGQMPLENWLQDVIKDQNILGQLRQTLGFNTSADSDEAGGDSGEGDAPPPLQPLQ